MSLITEQILAIPVARATSAAAYALRHPNISTEVSPATPGHTEKWFSVQQQCTTSSVTTTTETQRGLQSLSDKQGSRKQSLNRPEMGDTAVGQPAGPLWSVHTMVEISIHHSLSRTICSSTSVQLCFMSQSPILLRAERVEVHSLRVPYCCDNSKTP